MASGVKDVAAALRALSMGRPSASKPGDDKRGKVTVIPKVPDASSDRPETVSQFELMPADMRQQGQAHAHGTGAAPVPLGPGETPQRAGIEAVLNAISTVASSKKIDLTRRQITPAVASIVAHRVRHVCHLVHALDLSHNPLHMAGLHNILQAIHDARHIQSLNFSCCQLSLEKHLKVLQNPPDAVPAYDSMGGDEDGDDALEQGENHEPDATAAVRRVPTLVDSTGQEKHFAPLTSHCVFLASSVSQPATTSTKNEQDQDPDGDDAGTLTGSELAAVHLKEFLQDIRTLEQLDLSNNDLGIGGAFLLFKAAENSNLGVTQTLRVLNVSNSLLGMKGAGVWLEQVLCSCKALTHLNISNNGIRGPDACRLVNGIGECPSLEEMHAAHNGFGEEEPAAALGNLLELSKSPNLRLLDLQFNRFHGSRLGPWPDDYNQNKVMFSHVLRILDSLLPMLQRFPGSYDPVLIRGLKPYAKTVNSNVLEPNELNLYRRVYASLSPVLDQELATTYQQMRDAKICSHDRPETQCPQCGAFTGSIMHLLPGLAPEKNVKLAHLLLGGNMLSDEVIGTILHVASKMPRQTRFETDGVTFEPDRDGGMRGQVCSRSGNLFPISTVAANGYSVLSVKARRLVLDCGTDMLNLDMEDMKTHLVVSHRLETGLRSGSILKKPEGLALFQHRSTFLPPAQVAFEKQLAEHMLSRSNSPSGTVLQLGCMLRTLNGNIADLKSQNTEALQTALIDTEHGTTTRAPAAKVLNQKQIRNVGNQLGHVEWMPLDVPRAKLPPRTKEAGKAVFTLAPAKRSGKILLNNKSSKKLHVEASHKEDSQAEKMVADLEGSDNHYKRHEMLPTFACAERFEMGRGPANFFILHPVEDDDSYRWTPSFFSGKGSPSIKESLGSLKMRGDLIKLASESAANGKVDTYWNTISVIRRGVSIKDAWVRTTFKCAERHVIGEPFRFEYYYQRHLDRDPDSYRMDWIGLYKVMDEKAFHLALDTSQRVGCSMVMAKFRPPHALNAQVQLRHFIWEPGLYQLHMNLVNSEKVVGSSPVIRIDYAHAELTCPTQVAKSLGDWFELKYALNYAECMHPPTDWIGIFERNPPSYTAQAALQRLMVPPKNIGVIQVDVNNLRNDNEICYFQDFGSCERIIGKASIRCTHRIPVEEPRKENKRPAKLVKYQKKTQNSEQRHIRFYLSGTFADMQEERKILHGEVMAQIRLFCDSRRISVSFVDVRHGLSEGGGIITDRLTPEIDETYLDRCLMELDKCIPFLICLLGQVYGEVPSKLPSYAEEMYPFLADPRYANKAVTQGCRMSMTEMEVLSACLLEGQESQCKQARFYMRDPGYTADLADFKDKEEWEKFAMEVLMIKIKRAADLSKENDPQNCMGIRTYHKPIGFGKVVTKDILDICGEQYPQSEVPGANELFYNVLDAESAHQRRLLGNANSDPPKYCEGVHDFVTQISTELHDDAPQARRIVVTGASGSGKSVVLARWVHGKIRSVKTSPVTKVGKALRKVKAAATLLSKHRQSAGSDPSPGDNPSPSRPTTESGARANKADYSTITEAGPGERVSVSHTVSKSGKNILVVYLHGAVHHRIRQGFDLIRSVVMILFHAFGLELNDDQAMDGRLNQTLNHRLKHFDPESWTVYLVLDGIDRVGNSSSVDEWLPKTKQPNVHWLLSSCDDKQVAALHGHRFHELEMPHLTHEQREDLLRMGLTRHRIPHNEKMLEALKTAELSARPEFIVCAIDVLRLCTRVATADALTQTILMCQTLEALHETILRKWASETPGADLVMALLSLSETGLYEYELIQLVQTPEDLGTHALLSIGSVLQDVTFSSCGVRKIFNVKMFDTWRKKVMDKALRENALHRMEAYFGALPTCNRKLDEYAFVLEKLNAWDRMYTYVTDITIFHQMYTDPVRKLQFLSYMEALKKTPEAVQESLRLNFESHFRLSKRWFCSGNAYYYELNPVIYLSRKQLFFFEEIVYTLSSFFELHGKHEECIRDLESSLKALFGISDLFQIARCKPESCLFPMRVAKILRRLSRLYTLHLDALVEHWLAPNDIGLPKRNIPDSVRGLDIEWWATPVPEGGARTLPQKLKLVFVINNALSRHYMLEPNLSNVVEEIREVESEYGYLANLVWNTGHKCFVPDEGEVDKERGVNYGKTLRDPATMRPLPVRINHSRALSPGYEARRRPVTSMSPTKAAMLEEKRAVHKETSLVWSQSSGEGRSNMSLPPLSTSPAGRLSLHNKQPP